MSTNEKRINSRSIQKHDLEVNWNKATGFIPYKGEFIVYDIEIDENNNALTKTVDGVTKTVYEWVGRTEPYTYERFKIGDGIQTVIDLPFTADLKLNALLNIDYDAMLKFDTNEIIISSETGAILDQAILG